jgi:hypothetical protein
MQNDLGEVIGFSTAGQVGRYYFPFFAAWFLGVVTLWFEAPLLLPPAGFVNPAHSQPPPGGGKPAKKERHGPLGTPGRSAGQP